MGGNIGYTYGRKHRLHFTVTTQKLTKVALALSIPLRKQGHLPERLILPFKKQQPHRHIRYLLKISDSLLLLITEGTWSISFGCTSKEQLTYLSKCVWCHFGCLGYAGPLPRLAGTATDLERQLESKQNTLRYLKYLRSTITLPYFILSSFDCITCIDRNKTQLFKFQEVVL